MMGAPHVRPPSDEELIATPVWNVVDGVRLPERVRVAARHDRVAEDERVRIGSRVGEAAVGEGRAAVRGPRDAGQREAAGRAGQRGLEKAARVLERHHDVGTAPRRRSLALHEAVHDAERSVRARIADAIRGQGRKGGQDADGSAGLLLRPRELGADALPALCQPEQAGGTRGEARLRAQR
jgi:hypothetical protein